MKDYVKLLIKKKTTTVRLLIITHILKWAETDHIKAKILPALA